ncbi:MAG: protein kinase domain-containing protein [Bryobacteraceae bacterium]
MALTPGMRLGHYEIVGPLGAGGMGEVYRARDTKLKRDVAIKVLPAAFARDPERLARFTREAEVLAALNHPNIATIYGVEEGALVMELVEGETLAEIVQRGPLPLDAALAYAAQIADALEAAHEKGIVHRDLKPANVKVTPERRVKVLDFGLAAVAQASACESDPQSSPTLTISPTRAGVILGTAAYMSPEQARGKTVDKRADIWAFGVVLYELLTGRLLFQGEDLTETLAAVVKEEPRLEGVPPQVRRLLRSCLEKDPKNRLRDIGDAWKLLEEAPSAPAARGGGHRFWWPAAAALLAGLATWGWLHTKPPAPGPVIRWTIPLPATSIAPMVALSRDGTRMAYTDHTPGQGVPLLMLRMMDQLEAKPIPGSEGGAGPSFSPDGQWLVYTFGPPPLKVKKIPVTGGTPITLCDGTAVYGASWGAADTILLGGVTGKGLLRVAAAGGAPQTLTTPDAKKGETTHRHPQWLPGGRAVLFTIATGTGYDTSQIAVLDLKKGGYRVLVKGGSDARYIPTGHLVYARGGTLLAVPFDVKRMAVTGAEAPVVEGVASYLTGTSGRADYAVADSGLLVYRPDASQGAGRSLVWADRRGNRQPINVPPRDYRIPRVSPDGDRAAVEIAGSQSTSGSGNSDIWVVELARGVSTRLTSEGSNTFPAWTPDTASRSCPSGRQIAAYTGPRRMEPASRSCSWQPRRQQFQAHGRRTAKRCSTINSARTGRVTSGCCPRRGEVAKASPAWFWRVPSMRRMWFLRPTGGGWRTNPMRRGATRSTCGHFPGWKGRS